MKKVLTWLLPTIVAAYIIIYSVLTLMGEYRISSSLVFGIPSKTVWQPHFLRLENRKALNGDTTMEGNFGGLAFMPLILVDRTIWHRDSSLIQGVKDNVKESMDE